MSALTPEQQVLKQAALAANKLGLSGTAIEAEFRDHAHSGAILALLAQLEGCNEDYGQAVDSVAQLQDEVFEVRAKLEAAQKAPPDVTYHRPPITPEEAISFIGSHYDSMVEADDPANVRFTLSVHDLLSAFDWWSQAAASVPAQTGTVDYGASINAPYLAAERIAALSQPVQPVPDERKE